MKTLFAALVFAAIILAVVYVVRRRVAQTGVVSAQSLTASQEDPRIRAENIERVKVLARHRIEVSVSDVQDMLGFDRAQAREYLVDLAASDFIVLIGMTGRGEVFRVK